MKIVDLNGQVFNDLTVIGLSVYEPGKHKMWRCRCKCGKEVEYRGTQLTRGDVKSCGCARVQNGIKQFTKHGLSKHSAYPAWRHIMQRCHNPKSKDYPEYGGRGIVVCERWQDVANFIADMGGRPLNASIERIRNYNGYGPGNCRWSNPIEQANNTRNNVYVEIGGQQFTLAEAARHAGVKYKAFHYLVHTKKMTAEAAIETLRSKS
jgi:hypothetical protein